MRDLIIDSFAGGGADRADRHDAIRQAIARGRDLTDVWRERPDLWPRTMAGERMWSRDKVRVRSGIRTRADDYADRREEAFDIIAETLPATTREVAAALGESNDRAWDWLRKFGAQPVGCRKPLTWTDPMSAQLGARAREAA